MHAHPEESFLNIGKTASRLKLNDHPASLRKVTKCTSRKNLASSYCSTIDTSGETKLLLLKEGRGKSMQWPMHMCTHRHTHITPNHTFWGTALKYQVVYLKVFNLKELNASVQFVLFQAKKNTPVSEEKPGAHGFSCLPAAINGRVGTALNTLTHVCLSSRHSRRRGRGWAETS